MPFSFLRRLFAPRIAPAPPRLATVAELESPPFRAFMAECNCFAEKHGLRTFTDWSKVWEYPWLYTHGLAAFPWRGRHLVDFGSELSPLPWLLAARGARVTLIEADPQWVPVWEQVRATLGVKVDWHIVSKETLPLPDACADAVTSFSVIEHVRDKARAVAEIARILKPRAPLFISFDICEPAMGMTFPEWNGRALTLEEFEREIWFHPAFGNREKPPWNLDDMPAFRAWHLRSAPHHNYVVGAAVLVKRG
jgi:SAM-dependent methyltransferase